MTKKVEQDRRFLYRCGSCGFHYSTEAKAKECEAWCSKHNSCNLEIIKDSYESNQAFNRSK